VKKTVIGITTSYVKHNEYMEGTYIHQDYALTIEACGGIPVLIPNTSTQAALQVLDLCDALLISGGEDVDPRFYESDPHPNLGPTNPIRDEIEIELIYKALKDKIPTLAICRGLQIVNVTLGGTLIQDIPSVMKQPIQHFQKNPRGKATHRVLIQRDSQLNRILGKEEIFVNSLHHQAIDRLSSSLVATASSKDGIIEAVEYPDHPFFIGVQWHPESMYMHGCKDMKRLFQAFIEKAMSPNT
jgi:putative glutamine amidotransferase